ncbi:AhpC-TSA-domain-containing protein [Trichodelitschia bisporula]|uniref:thioredoxin-dependent peroxiredoxin n=1 Tax=Trichodelitschia bisporula TaxID=703511 RepID=A0A6G1HSZ2_9PEZI|nr:AhpC-TSA-domain-containing protein [Trichodelitschia bisporula]
MVELRKRKTPPPAPTRPTRTKKTAAPAAAKADAKADAKPRAGRVTKAKEKVSKAASKAAAAVTGKTDGKEEEEKAAEAAPDAPAAVASPTGPPKVGDVISLESFGGEVETHEGTKVTLAQLVEESKAGVVLFTYPKASTPGCTTQACAFRDQYEPLTATGLAIYGLSGDSPKANTTFRTKHGFPYPLLCDPGYGLIGAIGLQQVGAKKTKRGVFVVGKGGKVLAAEPGGPLPTVEVVKKVVAGMENGEA